jgi:hypothetical protein
MQSRIVLRDSVLERGEELLRATKLGSLTELINVMFARYGGHLEQTWEVKPMFPSLTQPEVLPQTGQATSILPEPDFSFDEPITGL